MAGLKHDAHQCRQTAKSELIRHGLGILTPVEQAAQEAREAAKHRAEALDATKGKPLPLEGL